MWKDTIQFSVRLKPCTRLEISRLEWKDSGIMKLARVNVVPCHWQDFFLIFLKSMSDSCFNELWKLCTFTKILFFSFTQSEPAFISVLREAIFTADVNDKQKITDRHLRLNTFVTYKRLLMTETLIPARFQVCTPLTRIYIKPPTTMICYYSYVYVLLGNTKDR